MAGMRNKLIHEYFGVDLEIVWAVIKEDLPPLLEKYAGQLVIVGIDVSIPEGQKLYRATVDEFGIPDERLGVPTLVVGETVYAAAGRNSTHESTDPDLAKVRPWLMPTTA